MNADVARLDYLRWLSRFDPKLYREVTRPQAVKLGNLGWINFVVQAVVAAGGAVMAKKQADKQAKLQKKAIAADQAAQEAARKDAMKVALLDINTKRAQAGLPPVDENGKVIGQAELPPAPSNLAPYYSQSGVAVPVAGSNNLPLYLGAGVVGLGLLYFLLRGRRS